MDPSNAIEPPTVSSSEEMSSNRPLAKGILKKSVTSLGRVSHDRAPLKRTATNQVRRVTRVSFTDRAKNLPISTIFEVEPIVYDELESPKGRSCSCFIF